MMGHSSAAAARDARPAEAGTPYSRVCLLRGFAPSRAPSDSREAATKVAEGGTTGALAARRHESNAFRHPQLLLGAAPRAASKHPRLPGSEILGPFALIGVGAVHG